MRTLINHLLWKILALASAFTLWFVFAGETEIAAYVPVIVQYRHAPQNLEISSDHPDRLFLKLRGPASRLSAAELAQTSLVFDLTSVSGSGEQTFAVDEQSLRLPAGVSLVRVVPSQVRLIFEKRGVRDIPVEVRYAGPPSRGYRIATQQVVPATVRVVGPESRLGQLEAVSTDAVDLSSTVGASEFRVPLFISDPQLRFEPGSPIAVVRVTLEKIPE